MKRHDVSASAVFKAHHAASPLSLQQTHSSNTFTACLIKLQGLRFIVSFEHTGLSFLEPPGPLLRDVIGAQYVD